MKACDWRFTRQTNYLKKLLADVSDFTVLPDFLKQGGLAFHSYTARSEYRLSRSSGLACSGTEEDCARARSHNAPKLFFL